VTLCYFVCLFVCLVYWLFVRLYGFADLHCDSEGVVLVDREVLAIAPRAQSKVAVLPLRPTRNAACTLRIQTHVALRSSGAQVHVFETDVVVPKFSAFKLLSEVETMPRGFVTFSVKESNDRFGGWFQTSFLYDGKILVSACLGFVSVRGPFRW
jgi:hypothetical protein